MAALMASGLAFAPQAAGVETWDYALTYVVDDATSSVTYSVAGVFNLHPECLSWSVSAPVTSTTTDLTKKHVYNVSLTGSIIVQSVQENGTVTKHQLTCPGGAVQLPNEFSPPAYRYYENGCDGTNQFVTEDSNPTAISLGYGGGHFQIYTSKPLWERSNTCVVAKVGTQVATVPFTGLVASEYASCDPSWTGCSQWHGGVCSPRYLGGAPISPNACSTFKNHPRAAPQYYWSLATRDLASQTNNGGIGSFGGQWMTTSG